MVSGKWREMLETCTKTLMCKQPRHACLRCSCLKHACLDLLCKRAFRSSRWISILTQSTCMSGRRNWSFSSVFVFSGFFVPLENFLLIWLLPVKSFNFWTTIIFHTVWHFASASSLKFSHHDHIKDNDWIFNLNEISKSNTNQKIQWPIAFGVSRPRICRKQNTHFN